MRNKKIISLVALSALLMVSAALAGYTGLPPVRSYPQLNEETGLWIKHIETVKASGQVLKVRRGDKGGPQKLEEILGPYLPVEKVKELQLSPNGEFSLKMSKEHVLDLPTDDPNSENKYIRVTVKAETIKGCLVETKTNKLGIPVKVLVFFEPHTISVDPLNAKRESTVPGIAKMMGMLPKIVALAYHEDKERGPLVAPQLNGMGTAENPRLIKDLLFIEDTLYAGAVGLPR